MLFISACTVSAVAVAALILVFYLTSAIIHSSRFARLLKPLRLTTMFTSMNAALLVGFFRWFRGSQKPTWDHTARLAEDEAVTYDQVPVQQGGQ